MLRAHAFGLAMSAALPLAACSAGSTCAPSSAPATGPWARTYGGPEADYAQAVAVTSNGDLVIAAEAESFGGPWVLKLTPGGDVRWQKKIHGLLSAEARAVAPTRDGGVFVLAPWGRLVVRLDCAGDVVWARALDNGINVFPDALAATHDGGVLVSGTIVQDLREGFDCFVAKLAADGRLEWDGSYGRGGFLDESCGSLVAARDGTYFAAGEYERPYGERTWSDVWLLKLDGTGRLLWQKSYGRAESWDRWPVLREHSDGSLLLASTSEASPTREVWVLHLDREGEPLGQLRLGTNDGGMSPRGLAALADGGFALTGSIRAGLDTMEDVWLARFGPGGELQWSKRYGEPHSIDRGADVGEVVGQRLLVVGDSASYRDRGELWQRYDAWVIQVEADGRLPGLDRDVPTSVAPLHVEPLVTSASIRAAGLSARSASAPLRTTDAEVQAQFP